MKQKIRPLSPHLTIYKPQLTSLLSIFHRITGGILSVLLVLNFVLFYCNLVYVGLSLKYCLFFDFSFVLAIFVLIGGYFTLAIISFHIMNGVRHLSWDLAFGLEIKNLYTTGSIVLSLVCFVVILSILI